MQKFLYNWLVAFACLLFSPFFVRAQAPAWQMALAINSPGTSSSGVIATATDTTGNVYLAGQFTGSITLGSTMLTSNGGFDLFVAKWHPMGGFVWAQAAGGTGLDGATSVVVSGSSVYVAGGFQSPTVRFGTTTLTNANFRNVFVAKLTDAGSSSTWVWAQSAGGLNGAAASSVAVSGSNVYVAGNFTTPTARFGSITLTSAGDADVFVAKLTDMGMSSTWTWAQAAGGARDDFATSMVVSGSNVYVAGNFRSPMALFGTTTLTDTTVGTLDAFVVKLTDISNISTWTWAQAIGGPDHEQVTSLAMSGSNVYVVGTFVSLTVRFGTTTLTNPNAGYPTVFVAKLTDTGNTNIWTWAQAAGPGSAGVSSVAVIGNRVYMAGGFSGPTVNFGTTTLTNSGFTDVFVAKLTDTGSSSIWTGAQGAGGPDIDYANSVVVNDSSLYVAGTFASSTIRFGSINLANTSGGSSYNGFLAALTDPVLSTPEELGTPAFTLAPNPAHHTATLTGAPDPTAEIVDALGRIVRTLPLESQPSNLLDLKGLTPGLYVVRCGGRTRRLVVE